jgi:hypothetical protein
VILEDFYSELADFKVFGTSTSVRDLTGPSKERISVFTNEFWTSKQRAASSLHEVSYRACFKPQLPRFFIERLTEPRDLVYDPFMGRGTTVLEAALLGRRAAGCDVNPLSSVFVAPRLDPSNLEAVQTRLHKIDWNFGGRLPEELLAFYHPDTLRQICALREELRRNRSPADAWIRMVATNRLTGHSKGFFSVLYDAAEPGRFDQESTQDQSISQSNSGGSGCPNDCHRQDRVASVQDLPGRARNVAGIRAKFDSDDGFERPNADSPG